MCATINAFRDALACDNDARSLFDALGSSHRLEFQAWITEPETQPERLKRIAEAVDILAGRRGGVLVSRRN